MINSKEDLINHFQQGIKKQENLKIGIEHEKFLFNKKLNSRATYETISKVLNYLKKIGRAHV